MLRWLLFLGRARVGKILPAPPSSASCSRRDPLLQALPSERSRGTPWARMDLRGGSSGPGAGAGSLPLAIPSASRGQPRKQAGRRSLAGAPRKREASGDFQAAFYGAKSGSEKRQSFLEIMQGTVLAHPPPQDGGGGRELPLPQNPREAGCVAGVQCLAVRGAGLAQRP